MKPVTNYWTTYRRLWEDVLEGEDPARGLPDDGALGGRQPAVPLAAPTASGSPGCTRRTAWSAGGCGCAGERVDLRRHRAEPARGHGGRGPHRAAPGDAAAARTRSRSEDVTHLDRPGGHIGLMAGSQAREEIWPDIAEWLGERSGR